MKFSSLPINQRTLIAFAFFESFVKLKNKIINTILALKLLICSFELIFLFLRIQLTRPTRVHLRFQCTNEKQSTNGK